MHEAEQKLNAACYFKKELYDDKAWQERNGVSIEDCFEVMFLTCLHVCTHAVIYEIWWGFRETSLPYRCAHPNQIRMLCPESMGDERAEDEDGGASASGACMW